MKRGKKIISMFNDKVLMNFIQSSKSSVEINSIFTQAFLTVARSRSLFEWEMIYVEICEKASPQLVGLSHILHFISNDSPELKMFCFYQYRYFLPRLPNIWVT